MAKILCYTRRGEGVYPDDNYPGHVAYLCDLEHALHLAVSEDGVAFKPLRNNTGVLFAECAFCEDSPAGITKTLIDPWLTRGADGGFVLCMLRRNQNAPDPLTVGSIMLFASIVPTRTQMNYAKRGKPVFSPQGKADCKESRWECG